DPPRAYDNVQSVFDSAATELVGAAGAKMRLGGAATGLHAVTRQILGYREERSADETSIVLTATLH
ncbi:MAG: hypothetical protein Q8Q58_07330, partial [Candidatus Rokubacteria bacterium]|nr:hypothetical protein [Candidatus Rokubacteria bacterium]